MSNSWHPPDIGPICAEAQAPLTQCSQTGYMFLALITQLFGGYKRNGGFSYNPYTPQFGSGYTNGIGFGLTSPSIETSVLGPTQISTFSTPSGSRLETGTQIVHPTSPQGSLSYGQTISNQHFPPNYFKPAHDDKFGLENRFKSPFASQGTVFDYNFLSQRRSDTEGADSKKVVVKKEKTKRREGKLRNKRQVGEEYDFIIVGAGSAGCVLANRLSEVKKWRILLLEAGTEEPDVTQVPAFAPALARSSIDWNYRTQPEELTCRAQRGQTCAWLSGKVMGGSSSINYLVYMRGNKRDYDGWAELGNEGWSYREVLPYFKKSENNRDVESTDKYYHGSNGPLTVERFKYADKNVFMLVRAFQEAGLELTDFNGKQQIGTMITQTTSRDGQRISTNTAFINPIRRERKNLFIRTGAHVTKVLIDPDSNLAYGVEYIKDGRLFHAYSRQEVILSAGALNSPKILMLSGVGPKTTLHNLNIPVLMDLKVGHNLQDHVTTDAMLMELTNKSSTIVSKNELFNEVRKYYDSKNKDGPLSATGPLHISAFIRTEYAEEDKTVPDIQFHFDARNLKEFYQDPTTYLATGVMPVSFYDSMSIRPILLSPESRGHLTLNTTDPVFGQPLIFSRFFTEQHDLDTLVSALQFSVTLENTKSFIEYGVKYVRKPQEACSNFIWGTYDYFKCLLTRYTTTIFHPSGTCKMGPSWDTNAVVNPRLRVYGIKHLRVADASVMPKIVRGNTNAPAIMIGEKAADIIKEDWNAL